MANIFRATKELLADNGNTCALCKKGIELGTVVKFTEDWKPCHGPCYNKAVNPDRYGTFKAETPSEIK